MKTMTIDVSSSYLIHIEKGITSQINSYLDEEVVLITDENVYELYRGLIKEITEKIIVIPAGENSKGLETLSNVYTELIELGVNRDHTLVAFGGGVVGDFAGFVASTYKRGLKWVNVPTTLLSQVDSSIGGKTGINFCGVKNIIGAFHQPNQVFIDTELLRTLSPREFSNGVAEIIKAGCIKDKSILEDLISANDIEDIIIKALEVKKHYVESDELDLGDRMILNFGHTIGHAIEASSDFLHGESVAIAMSYIIKSDEFDQLLTSYNLPTREVFLNESWKDFLAHDKKMINKEINFVELIELGRARITKKKIQDIIDIVGY